jgi:hypothetical protein
MMTNQKSPKGNTMSISTTQGTVLFIDEESGPRRLANRISEVIQGHYADDTIPLGFISMAALNLSNSADVNALQTIITQNNVKLVIIDALADIMPGADENSVRDVQPIFMNLRRIASATQSAIVLIHHANRSGGYRGSSAFKGAVDTMIMCESKKDSPNIDFRTEKTRDTEPQKFSAVIHFRDGQVWLSPSDPKDRPPYMGKSQKYVIRFLSDNGSSLIKDITAHADTCSEGSARNAVYTLASLGYVSRVDGGGPGELATYDLTDKGTQYAARYLSS